MIKMHNLWLATAVASTLALSACGGGGGGGSSEAVPDTTVPASAGASVAAFMAFIQGLDPNDESSEPLTISDSFVPPVDDAGDGSA